MIHNQIILSLLLLTIFILFLWGRWRYDVVAFFALMLATILGLIPINQVFSGFSNPATITVAEVLILSRVLKNSGIAEIFEKSIMPFTKTVFGHLTSISIFGALLSAFMNNVGAIALMMPTTISSAIEKRRSPSLLLMPLSFATILGGMVTAIGTPPNIFIASYRQIKYDQAFSIFDFIYVGLPIVIVGLAFICLLGWRLLPQKVKTRTAAKAAFEIEKYATELTISEKSELIDQTALQAKKIAQKYGVYIVRIVRDNEAILPSRFLKKLQEKDSLIVEGSHDAIGDMVRDCGLYFYATEDEHQKLFDQSNKKILEVLVTDDSLLVHRNVGSVRFQRRFGTSLIALSRQNKTIGRRLDDFKIEAGDILLFYGDADRIDDIPVDLNCIPLAERELSPPVNKTVVLPIIVFTASIILTALNILPIQISFGIAIIFMLLLGSLPLHELYTGINWSVIVLIGSFIPLGIAFENSGLAEVIVSSVLGQAREMHIIFVIAILLAVTMTLTDIINNTATAVIMAPISVDLSQQLGVNPDALLMTVAIAASCSFLTPIGHKNNALVMGPGGYKFGDYWRMGLPLELLILVTATPLIYLFWI